MMAKVRIEAKQLDRLRAATLLSEKVGDCLEPRHAARYALGDMEPADRERVERHYESCAECAESLERVFSGLWELDRAQIASWLKSQLLELRDPLRAFVRGLALPLAVPTEFRPALVGQYCDTPAACEGETPDGRLRWRLVEERDEVVVSFETAISELLRTPGIRLRWGRAVEAVVFQERAGHIVAWATFSRRQLAGLGPQEVPQLELLPLGW